MNSVFKCRQHNQVAIYINVKPQAKEPVLLCQRCILSKNYTAKLLEEFLLQAQPILGQYLSQDILDFGFNKKQFEDSIEKLRTFLYETFKTRINSFIQKLKFQFEEQKQILQYIKNQIIHYQKCGQNQTFLLDDQIEDQLRYYLTNQKSKNPKQKQIDYLYGQLCSTATQPPFINIPQIQEDFHEILDQFEDKIKLSKQLEYPNFKITIFSPEEAQNIDIDDFNISKTLVLNNCYPQLTTLTDSIEKVELILDKPIDLIGFSKYQQLKELFIRFDKCNVGITRQIMIPNLQKLTLDLKGNKLTKFDQLVIPDTIVDFSLDLSLNCLDENCIYYIGQTIDNLKLQRLSLNFNGFSQYRNSIWSTGLIQLCRNLFSQQLKILHLGCGRCSINDVGLEFGIIKLLSKQRQLEELRLDLYSNEITNLGELAKAVSSLKDVKVNANQNPLQNYLHLDPLIFSTLNLLKKMNNHDNYKLPSLTNSEQSIQNHFKQYSQPVRETWYQKNSIDNNSSNQIDINDLPNFEITSPEKQQYQSQFDHEFPPLDCSFKQEKLSFQPKQQEQDQQYNIEYSYKKNSSKVSETYFNDNQPQQLFKQESSQFYQIQDEPKQRFNFLYLNQEQISPQKSRQINYAKPQKELTPAHQKAQSKSKSKTPQKKQNPQDSQNLKYIILETNVSSNKKKFICQNPAPSYIILDFTDKENPKSVSKQTMQVQLSLKDLMY
ncbi:unnamed protein product (macronuclear) [Paramecium tetraurelia]|uniref:Uncharacterized protein n=1 Tax=Paramecium tetraurelia TaxID=5888 RepID=A0CMR0_PARTE|nr:uncharacterized protein GSPATT00008556001 [Paramecium tetraurelia]CAK72077.1 unnamed protein product [Paramecium tetraurelia]|eukprot:XP_001439474.1 hypothetical protein (macronuclear) [Paramecium tetraurelia strain d4-2]